MMPDEQPEASKYTIHIEHAEGLAIGDGAHVIGTWKGKPPIGIPFQAPPLPAHFVPRPEVSNALKARLLADRAPSPGILVRSAIHGMPGIGKSTLAAALAHDDDIKRRFPDGVLWVTLGQKPELLSHLAGWVQALSDYSFHLTTTEAATRHLCGLLQDKATLLVIDDAWEPEHVNPFLVGGPACHVLITTRESLVAKAALAATRDLETMTPDQAAALLSAYLHRSLAGAENTTAMEIARAVGHLPLALELVAAQVADQVPWKELLTDLRAEIARLESLESPGADEVADETTAKRLSLRASFNLSLQRLKPEICTSFAWLGVLPINVSITQAVATTLWDLDERAARDRLRMLHGKALLMSATSQWVNKQELVAYRLHDLLHDTARRLLTASPPEGLGFALRDAHAALLERYQARTQGGLWHILPDDGYVHEHLTWHMEQAEQVEAIHALLREQTPEGQNGWYEARERLGQTAGYLADVNRAWRLANAASSTTDLPANVGLQCRYALILASFNSLAWNIPTPVLAALVANALWTPVQGLAYARQSPKAKQRAEAIVALAPHLPPWSQAEALAATGAIEDERIRVKTWIELVPHLTEDLQEAVLLAVRSIEAEWLRGRTFANLMPRLASSLQGRAFQAVLLIGNEAARADALTRLIPDLPDGLLDQALSTARDLKDEGARVLMLACLTPRLDEPRASEVTVEAFELLTSVADDWVRAKTLAELAPNLPVKFIERALNLAQEIEVEGARARALMGIAPCLSTELAGKALEPARTIRDKAIRARVMAILSHRLQPQSKAKTLAEALDSARAISTEETRAATLVDLVSHLADALKDRILREALAAVQTIEDEQRRARALMGLSPAWTLAFPWETLAVVRSIEDESTRAGALIHLDPLLLTELSGEALSVAETIEDRRSRARALVGLIPHLPETQQAKTAKQALAELRLVDHEEIRANELANLGPYLPANSKSEAFDRAVEIERKGMRARALAGLASYLPPDLLQKALVLLQSIDDQSAQGEARIGLAGYLPASLQQEALNVVHMIEDDLVRTQALVDTIPRLVLDLRNSALEQALSAMPSIHDESMRAVLLGNLAPYLSRADTAGKALLVVHAMKSEWARLAAIQSLAPHWTHFSWEELLAVAKTVTTGGLRAKAMAVLLPHLPEKDDVIREAQATIQTTIDPLARAEALADLAAYLPEQIVADFLRQVLPEVRLLGHAAAQAKALTALATLGGAETESIVRDALKAARLIDDDGARVVALADLLPHLPADSKAAVLKEAIETVQAIDTESAWLSAYLSLTPYLIVEELRDALMRALRMENFVSRAESLKGLVPRLPIELRDAAMGEVLTAVQSIEDEWLRAETLAELASYIPVGLLPDALSVARAITDGWSQTIALKEVAQQLVMLPTETVYPLWSETLHALAARRRPDLLADLRTLAPVIAALGGPGAAVDTVRAIQDVGRWWP